MPTYTLTERGRKPANKVEAAVCARLISYQNSVNGWSSYTLEQIVAHLESERSSMAPSGLKYPPAHYCDIYIQRASASEPRCLLVGYQTTLRGQTLTLSEA